MKLARVDIGHSSACSDFAYLVAFAWRYLPVLSLEVHVVLVYSFSVHRSVSAAVVDLMLLIV